MRGAGGGVVGAGYYVGYRGRPGGWGGQMERASGWVGGEAKGVGALGASVWSDMRIERPVYVVRNTREY